MSPAARFAGALTLAVCSGLAVRALPLARASLERFPVVPGELYADGESARGLRRVALSLASGHVPARDRHRGLDGEGWEPDGPIPIALAAALAREAAFGPPARRELAPRRLEEILLRFGPSAGLLLIAVAAAAGGVLAGREGAIAGAFAAALLPAAVRTSCVGTVSSAPFVAASALASLVLGMRSLDAGERVDRLTAALFAGALAGLTMAIAPIGWLLLGALGTGALAAAASEEGEAARDQERAGLLMLLTAAVIARLPELEGPWRAALGGPMQALAAESGPLAIALALPLAAGRLARGRLGPTAARLLGAAGGGLVLVLARPGPIAGLVEPLAAYLDAPSEGPRPLAALLAGAALVPLAAFLVARRSRALAPGPLVLWLVSLGAFGAAALFHPPSALPAGLLACVALFDRGGEAARGRGEAGPGPSVPVPALIFALFGAGVIAGWSAPGARGERRALVRALRELEGRLPAAGPRWAASARPPWGLLAEPEIALLALWHCGRPLALDPLRSGSRFAWEGWASDIQSAEGPAPSRLPPPVPGARFALRWTAGGEGERTPRVELIEFTTPRGQRGLRRAGPRIESTSPR